jgi:hypothetical protein
MGPPTGNPEQEGAPPGRGGALPRMFFEVESGLDAIAGAMPESAGRIDEVKSMLRDVLATALNAGAPGSPPPPSPGGAPPGEMGGAPPVTPGAGGRY